MVLTLLKKEFERNKLQKKIGEEVNPHFHFVCWYIFITLCIKVYMLYECKDRWTRRNIDLFPSQIPKLDKIIILLKKRYRK